MQRAAEAGAASPELCIHVSTLLPFPHMQNPSTAQVSFKSSIPSKPVSSLEVFKGPKNTSRQARRLSLPHQQLHIACFHFPGKEQPWILEAATPACPANLSSWKTAKSSFFFRKDTFLQSSDYFLPWIVEVCFLSPQLPVKAGESVLSVLLSSELMQINPDI